MKSQIIKSVKQSAFLYFLVGTFMLLIAYVGSLIEINSLKYEKQKKHRQDSLKHRHDSILQINRHTNSEYYKF